MYEFIRGRLAASSGIAAVIDANGVGYRLLIPASCVGKIPQIGSELTLHVSYQVRETSHTLYGFLTSQERDLFELLNTVTGIGPKTALSLVSHLPSQMLLDAVQQNSVRLLSQVPGIGKKTAERLLVELKDKLPLIMRSLPSTSASGSKSVLPATVQDAISALLNLGYTPVKAQQAVQKSLSQAGEDADLSTLITTALHHL